MFNGRAAENPAVDAGAGPTVPPGLLASVVVKAKYVTLSCVWVWFIVQPKVLYLHGVWV